MKLGGGIFRTLDLCSAEERGVRSVFSPAPFWAAVLAAAPHLSSLRIGAESEDHG